MIIKTKYRSSGGGGVRVTQAYPLDTPLMELINFRLQRGGGGWGVTREPW